MLESPPTTTLTPRARQSRDAILAWLREGELSPGDKLPSESELSRRLKMNNYLVRRGLDDLKKAGVIINRPRVGNFLSDMRPQEMVLQLAILLPSFMTRLDYAGRSHPVVTSLHQQVMDVFGQNNCLPHIYTYDLIDQLITHIAPLLVERGVQGAILWGGAYVTPEHVKPFIDAGIKLVIYPHVPQVSNADVVSVGDDTTSLIEQSLQGLIDRGHRHILWADYEFRPPERPVDVAQKLCRQLDPQGKVNLQPILLHNEYDKPIDSSQLTAAINQAPRATAVVVPDEILATIVFRHCYQNHIRIPDDLSLLSLVDNAPDIHMVPLSAPNSVGLHYKMAQTMVQTLHQMINGEEPLIQGVSFSHRMIWRESVATINHSNR